MNAEGRQSLPDEALSGCELGKKDSREHQLEYAERTARKATDSDVRLNGCEAIKHDLGRMESPGEKPLHKRSVGTLDFAGGSDSRSASGYKL